MSSTARPSSSISIPVPVGMSMPMPDGDAEDEASFHDETTLLPRTSINRSQGFEAIISRIGMGKFQRQLLVLCGLGWLADNMWLQCVALILPRVQRHFYIPDTEIGFLSSSIFTGMMFGALFWGMLSDTQGRKRAFNWTLAITTVFGFTSSFAPTFGALCLCLFLLGFGVGGNMPIDGALFIEFIPKENQHLLTLLSIFFSFGAVISSIFAWIILPPFSCPSDISMACDPETQNNGWRYLLLTLGGLTLLMVFARLIFFRLQESPKFLLHTGRRNEALQVLRTIVDINGIKMSISTDDLPVTPGGTLHMREGSGGSIHVEGAEENNGFYDGSRSSIEDDSSDSAFAATGNRNSMVSRFGETFNTRALRPLFTPKWRKTTILVFSIWILINLGYTMVNVFMPRYLAVDVSVDQGYRDYVIYSLAGVPGSVIATYLIDTSLGRRGTMSASTTIATLCLLIFGATTSRSIMLFTSAVMMFMTTITYAVIYAYTPEVFETKVRGRAGGVASALGRIAGIIAPALAGILLTINSHLPLWGAALSFVVATVCMIKLPIETRGLLTK